MALQAATLHQLSGGRLILGLGVQARGYVAGLARPALPQAARGHAGLRHDPPRSFSGELVRHEGEVFSVQNFHLDMELPERR